ncbi:hypothetical protein SEUCBS139899_006819 [Sporothrix eucalyptigena]|uniref:N-acetyltransferase domain-containing protein n=1 Tax=Sporothrix eucalyptigena TaxID=1812306 RepID=A0ABP0BH24_9PEZI
MKVNENVAIATDGVLLVPYDRHHVPTYHAWMEDEAVRAATASERLTLDEEYENQESWRASNDKLTFIVCRARDGDRKGDVVAGVDDAPDRMVGDINFFLTPYEEDDGTESGFSGEVDVMIAGLGDRGKGYGRSSVTAFLHYILQRQRDAILTERAGSFPLRQLVVKIQATNAASIGLFRSFGFVQKGDVNYFGEVELVRTDLTAEAPQGYSEHVYHRDAAHRS